MKTYTWLALFSAMLCGSLQAQVTIANAVYGSDTPANNTPEASSGTFTLDSFTVAGVVGKNVFIEDTNSATSGVYGDIYDSVGTFASAAFLGATYSSGTVSVTDALFHSLEELTNPTIVAGTVGGTPFYNQVLTSQVVKSAFPGYNYSANTFLNNGPIQFTLNTAAAYTGSGTSSYTTAEGYVLDFYAPAGGTLTLLANSTYMVTAIGFSYNSTTYEIEDASATIQAAPEPGTWSLLSVGLGMIGLIVYRNRKISIEA